MLPVHIKAGLGPQPSDLPRRLRAANGSAGSAVSRGGQGADLVAPGPGTSPMCWQAWEFLTDMPPN